MRYAHLQKNWKADQNEKKTSDRGQKQRKACADYARSMDLHTRFAPPGFGREGAEARQTPVVAGLAGRPDDAVAIPRPTYLPFVVALAVFGVETKKKQLERITAEELHQEVGSLTAVGPVAVEP